MIEKPLQKVLLICKGSLKDGIGHVTRCRTVAESFREVAAIKMLIIGEPFINNLMGSSSLDYIILNDESEVIINIDQFKPDIVIFDLLYMSDEVFDHISTNTALTISLSPIFNNLSHVDAIFNRTKYMGFDWPTSPEKFCGLKYSIISNHVHRIPESLYRYTLQQDKLAVAISMGGTDAPNKTLKILSTLKEFPHSLLIWAILGEGYSHSYVNLVDCINDSKHEIILTKTNDSMWRILSNCALLILAGGTTTYEAAFAGLPTINILDDSKQFYLIRELVEAQVCRSVENALPNNLSAIKHELFDLYFDRKALIDMHYRTEELLDKQGASRIVNKILVLYSNKISNI